MTINELSNIEIVDGNIIISLAGGDGFLQTNFITYIVEYIAKFQFEGDVVFDFKNVKYMDSGGLSAILGAHKALRSKKKSISVINTNIQIKELFKCCSLYEMGVVK